MARGIRRKEWSIRPKPPLGVRVNEGHPLAQGLTGCWLFNEKTYSTRNVLDPRDLLTVTRDTNSTEIYPFSSFLGRCFDAPGNDGGGVARFTYGSDGTLNATPPKFQTQRVTILWRGIIKGNYGLSSQSYLFSVQFNEFGNSPIDCYSISRSNPSQNDIIFYWNNGTRQSLTVTNAITYGDVVTFALTIGPNAILAYKNGYQIASDTTNVGTISYSTSPMIQGTLGAGNQSTVATTSECMIWNRVLNGSELKTMSENPYAFLLRPSPRIRFFIVPAAPAAAALTTTRLVLNRDSRLTVQQDAQVRLAPVD